MYGCMYTCDLKNYMCHIGVYASIIIILRNIVWHFR